MNRDEILKRLRVLEKSAVAHTRQVAELCEDLEADDTVVMDIWIKENYVAMFMQRGYVTKWATMTSEVDRNNRKRRVTARVLVPAEHVDSVKCYSSGWKTVNEDGGLE